MANGTIKFFKEDKGFGFILGDDTKEYFFHISKVKSTDSRPLEGGPVTFSSRPGKKGAEAYDIILFNDSTAGNTNDRNRLRTTPGQPNERQQRPVPTPRQPGTQSAPRKTTFPYRFSQRPAEFTRKRPEQLHDRLNPGCCDIAFEVEWRALTPVAANPCSDPSDGTSFPANDAGEFQGYDKRWLTVDGRLALSPFTVKSAVANGFASLLGSCYRVEQEIIEHKAEPETFQCTGSYKRYRVPMDNSKPGILDCIDHESGEVKIIPVTEFFWDEPTSPKEVTFIPGQTYEIRYENRNHKNIITGLGHIGNGTPVKVIYYGPYRFGMNLTFGPGEFNKHHYHRFYRIDGKHPLSGQVSLLNLAPLEKQKKKVFMGVFKKLENTERHDKRLGFDGQPWHQDLGPDNPDLQPGKWVYYQTHKNAEGEDSITAIGLNFQFKTAFHLHDDAVPPGQQECTNLDRLCPRCTMFGITAENGKEAIGLRGRFKAATLTGPAIVDGGTSNQKLGDLTITLHRWLDTKSNTEIAGQFLLPIQGQAKNNKRNGGYFDAQTGMIGGAKQYLHTSLNYSGLDDEAQRVNTCRTLADYHGQGHGGRQQAAENLDYSHPQRNYAMVCRDGVRFSGTLGAENCTIEEMAALLMVLDHTIGGHGFKIGLGKAIGLGSMTSTIKKVWLRKSADSPWQTLTPPTSGSALAQLQQKGNKGKSFKLKEIQQRDNLASSWPLILGEEIEGLRKALVDLKTAQQALNLTANAVEGPLRYPLPGNNYWRSFQQRNAG